MKNYFKSIYYSLFGRWKILSAMRDGNIDKIENLIEEKPELVNSKNVFGETLLHESAFRGNREVTELLLQKGADVSSRDIDGLTPLHWAAQNGHREVAESLLLNGAKIDEKDNAGKPPIYYAALGGHKRMVEYMLSKGMNINEEYDTGETLLHKVIKRGLDNDMVSILIKNNADINKKDRKGQTPLSLAKFRKQQNIVDILQEYGAKSNEEESIFPTQTYTPWKA